MVRVPEAQQLTSQDGPSSRSATTTPATGQEKTLCCSELSTGGMREGCIRKAWVSSRRVSMKAPTRALFSTWKHRSECVCIREKKRGSKHCSSSHRSLSSLADTDWYFWWNRHSLSRLPMPPMTIQHNVTRGIMNSRSIQGGGPVPTEEEKQGPI